MVKYAITIILFLLVIVFNFTYMRQSPDISRKSLKEFPTAVGEWKSVDEQTIGGSSMEVLQVDDYIMRSYANDKNEYIGLYIGYFYNQKEGKQVHSPRQCLPGAGWQIIESKEYNLESAPFTNPINFYLMGKGDQRQIYLWWYQGRGRIINNEYINKLYLLWDSVFSQRTDGALVRFNMYVKSDIGKTLEKQEGFIKSLIPFLEEYIPN